MPVDISYGRFRKKSGTRVHIGSTDFCTSFPVLAVEQDSKNVPMASLLFGPDFDTENGSNTSGKVQVPLINNLSATSFAVEGSTTVLVHGSGFGSAGGIATLWHFW